MPPKGRQGNVARLQEMFPFTPVHQLQAVLKSCGNSVERAVEQLAIFGGSEHASSAASTPAKPAAASGAWASGAPTPLGGGKPPQKKQPQQPQPRTVAAPTGFTAYAKRDKNEGSFLSPAAPAAAPSPPQPQPERKSATAAATAAAKANKAAPLSKLTAAPPQEAPAKKTAAAAAAPAPTAWSPVPAPTPLSSAVAAPAAATTTTAAKPALSPSEKHARRVKKATGITCLVAGLILYSMCSSCVVRVSAQLSPLQLFLRHLVLHRLQLPTVAAPDVVRVLRTLPDARRDPALRRYVAQLFAKAHRLALPHLPKAVAVLQAFAATEAGRGVDAEVADVLCERLRDCLEGGVPGLKDRERRERRRRQQQQGYAWGAPGVEGLPEEGVAGESVVARMLVKKMSQKLVAKAHLLGYMAAAGVVALPALAELILAVCCHQTATVGGETLRIQIVCGLLHAVCAGGGGGGQPILRAVLPTFAALCRAAAPLHPDTLGGVLQVCSLVAGSAVTLASVAACEAEYMAVLPREVRAAWLALVAHMRAADAAAAAAEAGGEEKDDEGDADGDGDGGGGSVSGALSGAHSIFPVFRGDWAAYHFVPAAPSCSASPSAPGAADATAKGVQLEGAPLAGVVPAGRGRGRGRAAAAAAAAGAPAASVRAGGGGPSASVESIDADDDFDLALVSALIESAGGGRRRSSV